jgi:hypothetical protein
VTLPPILSNSTIYQHTEVNSEQKSNKKMFASDLVIHKSIRHCGFSIAELIELYKQEVGTYKYTQGQSSGARRIRIFIIVGDQKTDQFICDFVGMYVHFEHINDEEPKCVNERQREV